MAKLVDVYCPSKALNRRQLPLVIDEALTMVMDLRLVALVSDNQQVKGKELEDFLRKMSLLNEVELRRSLEVSRLEILDVLNQAVPCVGCRRSVERLYYQLFKYDYPTLDPLVINKDGMVTVREDKQNLPQFLCNLFHGHSTRLNHVVDSQPRRNKKSHRCLLHSLDSQRSRPVTAAWRDVWECMRFDCKKKVCTIDEASLHTTLETYLQKHRFCGECRTKVLKAYSILIEEPRCTDKGYVKQLYSGIAHCKSKHIHLNPETELIPKLIGRAESELIGSRRERHAKTLEIAQEEVLTCIGICMYQRLHRIYTRMREEECTCQVFAAVAVDALWRSFETAVEQKQGISQLELLYAELTRKEHQKQMRKEQKKLKRKRKREEKLMMEQHCKVCSCDRDEEDKQHREKADSKSSSVLLNCLSCKVAVGEKADSKRQHSVKGVSGSHTQWLNECRKCRKKSLQSDSTSGDDQSQHDCGYSSGNNMAGSGGDGYFEFTTFGSSLLSSPEGSEVACPDGCCESEPEYIPYYDYGAQLSLQKMLDDHFYSNDDSDCYITPEEVQEFKVNNSRVYEMRQQLRETLQKRFAQLCVDGPLQVP